MGGWIGVGGGGGGVQYSSFRRGDREGQEGQEEGPTGPTCRRGTSGLEVRQLLAGSTTAPPAHFQGNTVTNPSGTCGLKSRHSPLQKFSSALRWKS